ncbi:MAG: hypothetical protein VKL60_00525 [Sphaerospermopsis sp.]|nr:hypothetical protein [Sphaerospermopsis sp.]
MSLRPFFIASSLILSPLAAIGFGSAAFANTLTGDIPIGITVPTTANITVTATANAGNLENAIQLTQAGFQATKIADLLFEGNADVDLTVTSAQNGNLKNVDNENLTIPYKLAVISDNGSIDNDSILFVTLDNITEFLASGQQNRDLYIQINNTGNIAAGTYFDTLTLTVTARQ